MPTYSDLALGRGAQISQDRSRAVFGQTMGLVGLTAGCAALGAYVGRDLVGATGLVMFIAAFACMFGLQFAARRMHEQLAITLLFGMGFFLGMAVGPLLAYYAKDNPSVLWQAAGATAAFTVGLGTAGYASRRDLSVYARGFFFALLALLAFGLIAIFVAIPGANIIYCLAGIVIFGGFTVIDFNRLRRGTMVSAPVIAASIFLDIFNVFLLLLSLFGGGGRRR
jgi:FtsH-binding integral membrane protein